MADEEGKQFKMFDLPLKCPLCQLSAEVWLYSGKRTRLAPEGTAITMIHPALRRTLAPSL